MEFLTNHIALFLSQNGVIEKADEPIYAYGAEFVIGHIVVVFVSLLAGLLLGQTGEFMVFTGVFFALRGCAGGYHASTRLRCFVCSVVIMIVYATLLNGTDRQWHGVYAAAIILLSGFTLILIAPSQNHINPKTKEEMQKNKRKMIAWIVVFAAIAAVSCVLQWTGGLHFSIAGAFAITTILSGINSLQNIWRRKQNEKNGNPEGESASICSKDIT